MALPIPPRTSKINKIKKSLTLSNLDGDKNISNNSEASMIDFIAQSKKDIDEFNNSSWDKGNGYEFSLYKTISDKLEGLDEGLYLIAGESNSGKSAIMINFIHDLSNNPDNNVICVYYSLDDTKNVIYSRVIAMQQQIPISVCAKPKRYQNFIDENDENKEEYEEFLEKRKEGIEALKNNSDKLILKDSENKNAHQIANSTDLVNDIELMNIYAKSLGKKLIIAIDSINDIRLDKEKYGKGAERDEEIPILIKNISTNLHIPVFCSTHVRKLNANRRPTLDDLRDANTLVFEASMVWIVYNDISKNKQAAKVYWTSPDSDIGKPVIELDWAKNKVSSYKGRDFFFFEPNQSRAILAPKEAYQRYESLIYDI